MRIRIWNAFASNNSGSYTIVGSFPSSELASKVAAELAPLMQAHTLWLAAQEEVNPTGTGKSPLKEFVERHRLIGCDHIGVGDEWPNYSKDNAPQVMSIDHQVIIHHSYTITLPAVFGQYFYVRGGRVEHELDHNHNPLVAIFEFWVPWHGRDKIDVKGVMAAILEGLHAPDGALVCGVLPDFAPAWQIGDGLQSADLTVGVLFEDLIAGFTAVDRVCTSRGVRKIVKLFESFDKGDPLAFLRPSVPPFP